MQAPETGFFTAKIEDIKPFETSYGRVSYPENNPTNFGYIVNLIDIRDAYTGAEYDDIEAQVYSKEVDTPPWYHDKVKIKFKMDVTKSGNRRIKEVKDVEKENEYKSSKSPKNTGYSTYNNPLSIQRMALSTAQDITIEFIKMLNGEPKSIQSINNGAKIFYEWILKDGADRDRDIATKRYRALEKAVKCAQWDVFEIKDHKRLLEIAEEFIKPMNELKD